MANREKIATSRRRIILLVGLICCCSLFASVCVAKMINANPIEKDSALGVAGWDVSVSSSSGGSMTLDAGAASQSYSLVVTNGSDVASTYGIKVSNIPAGVKIGLDISSASDLVTPVNGEILFINTGGDLGYSLPNNTRTHVLTLAAEATANITQSSVNMTIEVQFVQKDPRI